MFAETIKKDIMNWDGSYTQIRMHSGRTDGSYGHRDWINRCGWGSGSYHYHHTRPAHLHPNGICPYGNEKVGSIINPYTGEKINLGTSYFYEGIHYFSLNLVAKALTANDVLGIENDGNSTGVFYACASGDSTLENLGEIFTFSLPDGTTDLHYSEFFETSDGKIQLLAAPEGISTNIYISVDTVRMYMTKDGYFTDLSEDATGCWSFMVRKPTVKVKIESPENCDSLRVGDEVTVQADIEHVASARMIVGNYFFGFTDGFEEYKHDLESKSEVLFSAFTITNEQVGSLPITVEVHTVGTAVVAETVSDTLIIQVEVSEQIRFTKDSANVRELPASSNVVRALNNGVLLIVKQESGIVKATLNEIDYNWINVSFYDDVDSVWKEGWIVIDFTDLVPLTIPDNNEVYFADRALSQIEMLTNARYIHSKLLAVGWSHNAICGVLGNMHTESFINPGFYERGYSHDVAGFGLVQWTPGKHAEPEYYDWIDSNGYDKYDIDIQLYRIQLESDDVFKQWQDYRHPDNMSFKSFTQSNMNPEFLAEVFLYCYERPTIKPQPLRGIQAKFWDTILNLLK